MKKFIAPSLKRINAKPKTHKAISFFAGCGGSSIGYRMAGFDLLYANEFVPVALETYKLNASKNTICDGRDIREIDPKALMKELKLKPGQLDLLDGSPPCAAFSMAGRRDKQWGVAVKYSEGITQRVDDLFDYYINMVAAFKPKVFVAENVPGLAMAAAQGFLLDIIERLRSCGYTLDARIVDPSFMGLAQRRRRLIIVGVRNDIYKKLKLTSIPYPAPQKGIVTIKDVLPHISRVRISRGNYATFEAPTCVSPTITASDSTNSLKSSMSCGGWVEDADGTKRKYTIPELKIMFGFPEDFKMSGNFRQQFERIGRSHSPCSTYNIGKTLIDTVLSKL